jgi:NADPH:quinone reductase-like Zn-dependent oxidoreductase
VGCVRSFELADGHRIREQLLALSDREHVSTYFLCRWAAGLGARVRGTVSTDEKARVARAHGCGVAIVARDGRFAEAVRGATGGRGAGVASDGLGRGAVEENLAAVAACGHRVSYSRASGAVDPVAPERLAEKSHTRSRPVVFHDTAAREALRDVAGRTLDAARRTVGPVVLPR